MAELRTAPVIVRGRIVKCEHKRGQMPAEDNPERVISWDFLEARVVTPEYDFIDVRFPGNGAVPVPALDEEVELHCTVMATRRGLRFDVNRVGSLVGA